MATITLEYDARKIEVKEILKIIIASKLFSVKTEKTDEPNLITKKAIKDAKNGKTIHCGSFDNYIKEMNR